MLFFILASKVVAKTIIEFKELEQRNANDVCEDYQNNFVWEKKPCYVPSGKTCVYGTQSKEDREMATKRVNFYRQLTGLATIPQTNSIAYQNRSDQTALIMEENKFMNHYLPENLKCWSSEGNWGALGGNLYKYSDYACSTDSIESYMRDENTFSLGHRRWILDPPLPQVVTSAAGQYSVLLTTLYMNKADNPIPKFIAYPPPGPIPYDIIYNDWSFSRHYEKMSDDEHNTWPDDMKVTISYNGSDYKDVSVSILNSDRYDYPAALSFSPIKITPGSYYRVSISSAKLDTEWRYTVAAMKCQNGKASDLNKDAFKGGLSAGTIAGIVIGVVLGVAIIVVVVVIIIKKMKDKRADSSAEDYVPKV